MKKISLVTLLCVVSVLLMAQGDSLYRELYRPQFHFSPKQGWIGDPSGLIHYQGKYQGFWWGKTESPDLVHWHEVSPSVMRHEDKNISFFTGSVTIDKHNTTGWGDSAFIAAYTSYEKDSKKQAQSISYSTDGETFHWYDNNPVIDLWSSEFRDPTVFYYPQTKRWVMVVAKALEKKVKIYTSSDLKSWQWESDFGPAGNSERSWECPDLFPLQCDGEVLWVLSVSINWAQEQYFVGHFDGKTFSLIEGHPTTPLYIDKGLDYYASRTFRDYDIPEDVIPTQTPSLGWVATWDYAQKVPSTYGKGFWSIPRNLSLKRYPEGVRLIQTPVEQLTQLRYAHTTIAQTIPVGVTTIPSFAPKENVYELDATFECSKENIYGLNLCCGEGRKLKISYDTKSQYLVVDRTSCAKEPIEGFDRIAFAKVTSDNGKLRLHIFVDKSSVEIFANDGKDVFTLQTFPAENQCGIQWFALSKGVKATINVWRLKSIWQ